MSDEIDVVVAGHIALDVTPRFLSGTRSAGEMFRPGTLVQVGPATIGTGGPVSNTALPLRRLGLDVRLMGKCGDDIFGRAIIERIAAEAPGAERSMRVVPGESSGYTIVINPPGVDRMFLHCPGANDTFGAEDVDLSVVARARLMHFGYPPLMARMFADGGEQLVELFRRVKSAGPATSLDMVYPDPDGPAGRADWQSILARTLPHVDIFTPSVEELLLMLRPDLCRRLIDRDPDGDPLNGIDGELLGELADWCIEAGAAVVLLKCGRHGLYARTAGARRIEAIGAHGPAEAASWTARELFEPSYRVERIVTATGAGDCAIAGLLAAYLRGCSLDDALRYACATGAQNCTAADTVSGVLTWERTTEQIRAGWAKNDLTLPMPRWRFDAQAGHHVGPANGND